MSTNLVNVLFATLAAEMADPDRFRRGRAYVRQQAVLDVTVEPGVARGDVQGSRATPYTVTIRTCAVRRAAAAAAAAGRLNALVPRPDDLTIACTCPDWGAPCKHGVAVLLALGDELVRRPELLAVWRMTDGDGAFADEPGEPDEPGTVASGEPPVDPLDAWFGRGYDPAPADPLPPLGLVRRAFDGADPTTELVLTAVDDARATLARAFGRH